MHCMYIYITRNCTKGFYASQFYYAAYFYIVLCCFFVFDFPRINPRHTIIVNRGKAMENKCKQMKMRKT